VAHAVLEEGPGWTWDALQTCYASPETYTEQLRQLEHFVGEHPANANVRFLLGYHYLMLNHGAAAERQLGQAVELESKDKLAANILNGLKTEATTKKEPVKTELTKSDSVTIQQTKTVPTKTDLAKSETAAITQTAKSDIAKSDTAKSDVANSETKTESAVDTTDSTPSTNGPVNEQLAVAVDAVPLSGTWKASPAKGVQIELALRADKTFTWKFTTNGKTQNFSGKYELGDKSLVLTRDDGESMDGTFERHGNAGFKFRMKDAEADDPGLNFSR
jgi:hypothetical protein